MLQLPPFCVDWCAVRLCHAGGGLRFIFALDRTLRILCFNFFNVWAYLSEVSLGTSLQVFHYQDSVTVPECASHNFTCWILHLEFVLPQLPYNPGLADNVCEDFRRFSRELYGTGLQILAQS